MACRRLKRRYSFSREFYYGPKQVTPVVRHSSSRRKVICGSPPYHHSTVEIFQNGRRGGYQTSPKFCQSDRSSSHGLSHGQRRVRAVAMNSVSKVPPGGWKNTHTAGFISSLHSHTQYGPETSSGSGNKNFVYYDDDRHHHPPHRGCDDKLCLDNLSNSLGIVVDTRVGRDNLSCVGRCQMDRQY